jgi:general secretion pathway protein G
MAELRKRNSRGFTLIELMIVISMMMILIAIAIPAYRQSIVRAKEGVLKQNLFTLRTLISQYTLDKQKAPESLEDLVTGGYIKQIPNDPITLKADWTVVQEDETVMSPDEQSGGIDDVHSSSDEISSDGTAYSTW